MVSDISLNSEPARDAPPPSDRVLPAPDEAHCEWTRACAREQGIALFCTVLEASPVPSAIVDAQQNITYLNAAFTHTFGYSLADIPTLMTWFFRAAPRQTGPQGENWLARVEQARREHTPFEPVELQVRAKDTSRKTVLLGLAPLGASSAGIHLVSLFDITARKQTEEALAHHARRADALLILPRAAEMLDEITFMHCVLELAEDLTDSTTSFIRILSPDQQSIELATCSLRTRKDGQPLFDTHPPLDNAGIWADTLHKKHAVLINAPAERQICVPVMEQDQVVMLTSLGNKPSDYNELDVETLQLLTNELWRLVQHKRALNRLRDNRDELEQMVNARTHALSEALKAAKRADAAKDAFLANISHELRTPLNAVIGMAHLARALSATPKQSDYIDKIVVAGKHLNKVIDDLLDLSKIAAGRLDFEQSTFSLCELISHCRALMAPHAEARGLALCARIDPTMPDTLVGDPARVRQILLNLLSNAIKFTPAGTIDIRVRALTQTANHVRLMLEVEDTGIGIRPEDLARLFLPFSQVDASVSRLHGGTGLGLAISRRLAEMMNGEISVVSTEGQGTTFKVALELEMGASANLRPPACAVEIPPPERYENASVLVVDDQPSNREIVDALLQSVGIVPLMAQNGQEALDILMRAGPNGFDLVLMDIQMPVMDGLSTTRALKLHREFASLPIIGMTAHTMEHEKKISIEAGMVDHIGKPIDTALFFQTLAKWIAAKKHQSPLDAVEAPCAAPVPAPPQGENLLQVHGLDVVTALNRFNGRMDRYQHWLRDFVDTGGPSISAVRAAIASGDLEAAQKKAHTIKGHVGMLGMTDLHGAIVALETALREGQPDRALLAHAENLCCHLCDELRYFFARGQDH